MADVALAAKYLRQGRLVAFPTETVYGLGADATNSQAVDLIYKTKGRPATNPLIIHVSDIETARRLVLEWPQNAQALAQRFWPGPLTLVLPKRRPGPRAPADSLLVPDIATAGLATVAVRVPAHPLALELLRAFRGALAAPSANRSTRVSPTTAQHVRDEFPTSSAAGGDGEPAMILDGGPCHVGIESTVLDLASSEPAILRPGHITRRELESVIGPVRRLHASHTPQQLSTSPGQQLVHYAPQTPAYRFESSDSAHLKLKTGLGALLLSPSMAHQAATMLVKWMPHDPVAYAQQLYGALRELDQAGLSMLLVEMPPEISLWSAVRDRLIRATVPLSEYRGA